MKERPIIFSAPMVRAILEGRKTVTRRVVRELPGNRGGLVGDHVKYFRPGEQDPTRWCGCDGFVIGWVRCPYGVPGDRLWVKEAFAWSVRDPELHAEEGDPENYDPVYRATHEGTGEWERYEEDAKGELVRSNGAPTWRSPLFMPRRASRLLLEVDRDVRGV